MRRLAALALTIALSACSRSAADPKALFEASGRGDVLALDAQIAKGADVNARDANGSTPLHYAAAAGQVPAIERLVAHGANPNATDGVGTTVLMAAAYGGHPEAVQALKKAGAEGMGTLGRVGLGLAKSGSSLTVTSAVPGSPAEKAGIKPDDEILAIDGESAGAMSLLQATAKLRGEKGQKVVLAIRKKWDAKTRDVTVVRDAVTLDASSKKQGGR